MPYKKILVLIVFFTLSAVSLFAQPKINSPYSRIGLGDLVNQNFGAINGMADISSAFHDPYHLNFRNPASLSYLNSTAFEIGLNARYGELTSTADDSSLKNWSGNLTYLALGFPTKNLESRILERDKSPVFWGMGFELQPYSLVGYNIQTMEIKPDIDTINYTYQGNGGSYQVLWGNGVRYKNLSFGLNMGFVFGTITNDRIVSFQNVENPYRNFFEDESSINGFVWNFGAQYHHVFRKKGKEDARVRDLPQLTLGMWGHANHNVNIRTSRVSLRFNDDYSSNNTPAIDTINSGTFTDSTITTKLPAEFGIGAMYRFVKRKKDGRNSQYKVGLDFSTAAWSNFENELRGNEMLENTWRFAVGGEMLLDNSSGYVKNYGSRIRYRLGAFYAKDPRGGDGNNNSLTNYGITVGLGLPIIISKETSFLNFAFELGKLSGDNTTLEDTYGKLTLGITFNDKNWFKKRKFN